MADEAAFEFKIATEPWEIEKLQRLNYQAFVEEIPQHPPNDRGLHIDKFHPHNTYLICRRDSRVIGTIAIREQRPFSLDQKLEQLDSYLPKHQAVCELRLLAIDRNYRNSRIFQGLFLSVCDYCEGKGYDLAIMSGTTRQSRLYQQLGFIPFGPLVGTPGALFQPMYLTLNDYLNLKERLRSFRARASGQRFFST